MGTQNATTAAQRRALYSGPEIDEKGNWSKSHRYNLEKRGHFPKACLVMGPRFSRYDARVVDQWFVDPAAWIAAHAQEVSA